MPRGKRQRASVDVVRAVRLHKIRKPARTADARDADEFLVRQLALFNELEIQREHREIAATGTPRRVIGGEFLFRQTLALGIGGRRRDGNIHSHRTFSDRFAHKYLDLKLDGFGGLAVR